TGEVLAEHSTWHRSLAMIKKAAAITHKDLREMNAEEADSISEAANEDMTGKLDDHFPLDMFVGGGGTPVNMNMNEVLANRANETFTGEKGYSKIRLKNNVHESKSTNDV